MACVARGIVFLVFSKDHVDCGGISTERAWVKIFLLLLWLDNVKGWIVKYHPNELQNFDSYRLNKIKWTLWENCTKHSRLPPGAFTTSFRCFDFPKKSPCEKHDSSQRVRVVVSKVDTKIWIRKMGGSFCSCSNIPISIHSWWFNNGLYKFFESLEVFTGGMLGQLASSAIKNLNKSNQNNKLLWNSAAGILAWI